ncbi:MAG TPA: TerB family tellurite resistance protein [Acetobacteraceae bacterium]|nr:TerB family tellurite resistance protein [Acetobacteraceae bacterium]
MGYWGKLIGGVAGFAMGGPFGAMVGAALGHAADQGAVPDFGLQNFARGGFSSGAFGPARIAALLGRRDQLFALSVVVLSAKLAKCDGPVKRVEIDAFRRHFQIPPAAAHDIGRLFDQARESVSGFEAYADQLGEAFFDNRGMLEDVLGALFGIARADGPLNLREEEYLRRVHHGFGLAPAAWERARGGSSRFQQATEEDPYAVLGIASSASGEELRAAWKQLMRENHPDSLAARGVPAEFIARAGEKVARINAAWDRIKRERGL